MKTIIPFASLCICTLFAATAAHAQVAGAELAPQFRWKPIPPLQWKANGAARIEDGVLIASCATTGVALAEAEIDISEYDDRPFELCAVVTGKGVAGFLFAVNYIDVSMGGNRWFPGGPRPVGDFGPEEILFTHRHEKKRSKAVVQIGLSQGRGEVRCDLSTLRIREPQPLVEPRNRGRAVAYPERVSSMPQMRGVSIHDGMTNAWDKVESWGAKIARYHMDIPWRASQGATNYEAYAERYRAAAGRQLDRLEKRLDEAHVHGVKLVVTGHNVGGGCSAAKGDPTAWQGDGRMFHDGHYADLFVWYWEQVAKRFAGRSEDIYGYDLVNEGCHMAPALEGCDIVSLQERAARAIRAIDPDATIIVESMFGAPDWFRSLSAIDLDNVVYSVHCYRPHDFTHQAIFADDAPVSKWPDESRGWNRDFIRRNLEHVIAFQKEHKCRILVGEFSAVAWAEGAGDYLRDCIAVFEELGWDWIYHEFRGYGGWNVELEADGRGRKAKFRPSADNPRLRALLDGLRGNQGRDDARPSQTP